MCSQYCRPFVSYPQDHADLISFSGVLLRKCDFSPTDEIAVN